MRPASGKGKSVSRIILRIFCGAVITAISFHIITTFLFDTQNQSMIRRGDFPAFYAAGESIKEGEAKLLYQPEWQQYLQNKSWPGLHGRYLYFSYPVWVALPFIPLTFFPPLTAKITYILTLVLCLSFAIFISNKIRPVWQKDFWVTLSFLISFLPLTASVLGGQNTAISMLCYGAFLYGIQRGDAKGWQLSGIALGLWAFKMQYAAFFIVFTLLAGFYRIGLYALGVVFIEYGFGSFFAGWDWPVLWFEAARKHTLIDLQFNAYQMVSLHGFSCALARQLGLAEPGGRILEAGAVFLSAVIFLGIGKKFLTLKKIEGDERRQKAIFLFSAAAPAVLLMSPHALFYDTGLILIVAPLFFNLRLKADLLLGSIFWIVGIGGFIFKQYFPVQPLFFVCAGVLAWFYFKRNSGDGISINKEIP